MKYIKGLLVFLLLITLVACDGKKAISYNIIINEELSKIIEVGDDIDFKEYFIITDSNGNNIEVIESMLDLSNVKLDEEGSFVVRISYEGIEAEITFQVEVPPEELTYTIKVNDELPTTFDLNSDDIDFKKYFVITDSKGNNVTVLNEMVDSSDVDFSSVGSYIVRISFEGLEKEITITVLDNTPPLTYEITINQLLSTEFTLGDEVDFKEYFVITDSLGNNFDVLDSMLDLTNVNLNEVGTFIVTLTFKDVDKSINFEVKAPDKMFAGDLFISEYSEGKSYNKYIEIFNGTGESVDLTNYKLKLFNNGNTPAEYEFELSGTLKDGEIYVVYNSSANATIKDKGSVSDRVISFNGNDPIALYKNDVLIDVVGDKNEQVSDGYDIGDVVDATKDNTIIRKPNVYGPNDTWTESEWLVLGLEDYSNLGIHEMAYYEAPLPEEEEEEERVPDLYISEYFEGSGAFNDSKYIEIYNGLDHDVHLSAYALQLYANGELEPKYVQALSGILNPNDVYIVYAPFSLDEIKEHGDLASEVAFFNGRHAIALTKNDKIIDVFGVIGEYPETNDGWFVDDYSGTANNTLIRHYDVTAPTTTWNKDEWYSSGENYLYDIGQHKVTYENQVIEDFDDLYGLITMLELDAKGTATSSYTVTIKGTVYMDVANETKLVYITDGKSFIKLHGDYMHNYTAPNTVYEITGYFKVYQYIPTFEVSDTSNIKALYDEEPVSNVKIKEVSLEEILNLEKEDFKDNIINGYLQSMLKVTGYLQLDDHNSSKWDYALTVNETYTKNNTQYINNGLYFKNNVEELKYFLIDYELHPDFESIQVDIYGVIYDWNPNRKNWRIYVASDLTLEHLDLE